MVFDKIKMEFKSVKRGLVKILEKSLRGLERIADQTYAAASGWYGPQQQGVPQYTEQRLYAYYYTIYNALKQVFSKK